MDKIYIVIEQAYCNGELKGARPAAFSCLRDAKKEMEALADKSNCRSWIKDIMTQSGRNNFTAYSKDRNNPNYYSVTIHETEVTDPKVKAEKLTVYTDGGYQMFKKEGAYAFIILQDNEIIHKEANVIRNESNNRAELKAIINAVNWCPDNAEIDVNSDSQYAIYTLSNLWQRKKNTDLFEEWDKILRRKNVTLNFNWVRGHFGNKYNEMCDQMCSQAVGYDLNS